MYFDTHAHYDEEAFDADRDILLSSLPGSGVDLVVDPGCEKESSLHAIALSHRYPHVYAAVGWHPHEAENFDSDSPELIRTWAKDEKVVAIGEIGLDFHYDFSPRDVQAEVLRQQLALADELSLPVIIHDREAHGECMTIINQFPNVRGVFHCYSGSAEMALELLKKGWYLGFTGAITFKNAKKALEVISIVPDDRYVIETDCPYLAPVPHRGERNDSRLLPYMAAVIADIKGISAEEAALTAHRNGCALFGIDA